MAYVKLSTNIIHSTIWREKHETVRVWIAMLALSDRDGFVRVSLPGLIEAARVEPAQMAEALTKFQSPDEFSRSEEFEGKRIAKVPGGWKILNYALYRDQDNAEERKEKDAERHRQSYARKKADKEKLKAALGECNPTEAELPITPESDPLGILGKGFNQ